jgi:hypothetical protein
MTKRILLFGWAIAALGGGQLNVDARREAMKKLDFLVGKWTGEATVTKTPGPSLKVSETQEVEFKNDGTMLTIESKGDGFEALATISYNAAKSSYLYNAVRDGEQVSAEFQLMPRGFAWRGALGAMVASSAMRLDEKGEWLETTQQAIGSGPPQTTFEVKLRRAALFDGKWITTVSCEASRGALGYSFRFDSEVKDGKFLGLHGTEGEPSSLKIEGKISEDGSATLYAAGRTGGKEFVPGRDTPRGTEYNYTIDAHFRDDRGTGKRIEGRACALVFERE